MVASRLLSAIKSIMLLSAVLLSGGLVVEIRHFFHAMTSHVFFGADFVTHVSREEAI
jgi:hypothetical protein